LCSVALAAFILLHAERVWRAIVSSRTMVLNHNGAPPAGTKFGMGLRDHGIDNV